MEALHTLTSVLESAANFAFAGERRLHVGKPLVFFYRALHVRGEGGRGEIHRLTEAVYRFLSLSSDFARKENDKEDGARIRNVYGRYHRAFVRTAPAHSQILSQLLAWEFKTETLDAAVERLRSHSDHAVRSAMPQAGNSA